MNRTFLPAFIEGLKHLRGQILYRMNLRAHQSGTTARQMPVEKARDYVMAVVDDYITYGANGDVRRLSGRDVLEIGPGDSLGVAMVLLAKGARSVTCVDGFEPAASADHNSNLYAAIYAALSPEERDRLQDVVNSRSDGIKLLSGGRLISRYRTPIDAGAPVFPPRQFDIILSRAVLEHLADLEAGWKAMVSWLRPDGEMWHKVDFRCHNLFEKIHPLYFLTVREPVWGWISRPDPTLNRARLPVYERLLARDFLHAEIYFTHIVGATELVPHVQRLQPGLHYGPDNLDTIQKIRPALLRPFAGYTDEQLLVEGIFAIACGVRSPG